ncbi:hypothetical protein [Streptomyces sp. NPDC021212]|uniref:hypothetical protein n=1 Tax=Streptomyces sp. NPDC021212 TaxID=3365118 RepID=UPI0037AF350F
MPRTVAARRALLAMLFLGGFLALGFLFGGSAHAAERGGLVESVTGHQAQASKLLDSSATVKKDIEKAGAGKADTTAKPVAKHNPAKAAKTAGTVARKTAHTATDAVRETVEPVREPVERHARQVTEPVDDLVNKVTDGHLRVRLSEVGDAGVGALGDAPGAHDAAAPGNGPAADDAGKNDALPHSARPAAAPLGPDTAAAAPRTADSDDHGHGTVVRADEGNSAPAPMPLPRSPHGTVTQCTGDSGAPRGGNAHAALPPSDAAQFGLAPGAVRADGFAPTRERYNEVLEFPG